MNTILQINLKSWHQVLNRGTTINFVFFVIATLCLLSFPFDSSGAEILRSPSKKLPAPILCVKFSPDGNQILAGYENGKAILWDVASGKRIREFKGKGKMESYTLSVAFHPTKNLVAVGHGFGFLRTTRLYDSSTGKVVMEIPFDLSQGTHQSVEFTPNGKALLACHQLWSITKKKPIWGFETCNSNLLGIKKQERQLFIPKWQVNCTTFTPNGRIVVLGGFGPMRDHYDTKNGFIAICNPVSGKIRSLIRSSEKIDLGSFVKHIACDTHGKKCLVVTYTGLFEMILRTGEVTELFCDINNAEIFDAIYGQNKHDIILGLSNNNAVSTTPRKIVSKPYSRAILTIFDV